MTRYVLVRTDGKYVSRPGSQKSYTNSLRQARIFNSREEAEGDRCPGNEHVETLEAQLGG